MDSIELRFFLWRMEQMHRGRVVRGLTRPEVIRESRARHCAARAASLHRIV